MDKVTTNEPSSNRDPITGAPGAHPVGVGVGAAAGGIAAGAAAGTLAAGKTFRTMPSTARKPRLGRRTTTCATIRGARSVLLQR
jgi:hypothetical protein